MLTIDFVNFVEHIKLVKHVKLVNLVKSSFQEGEILKELSEVGQFLEIYANMCHLFITICHKKVSNPQT